MTERPTRATRAGRAYLDLRKLATTSGRPTDELIQLYALEGFLRRLQLSTYSETLILKGGVLLAAYDARRPTRDIDLSTGSLGNEIEEAREAVLAILKCTVDDGLLFDTSSVEADPIRDEEVYGGLRVTITGQLASAALRFHVDVSFGDPIWPPPSTVSLPPLLGGVS